MIKKKKIVVTGGTGRFAQSLKKIKSKYNFIYPSKKTLDITNIKSIFRTSDDFTLANLYKDRDPIINDRLLNILQLQHNLKYIDPLYE